MNNKNSERKAMNCYEDECESMKKNNYNFELEFDMDEGNEVFKKNIENDNNEKCEDCEEAYQEGFKDGYEKALEEVLIYMKKNKCCIKCNHKSKVKNISGNKRFVKCKHRCKGK